MSVLLQQSAAAADAVPTMEPATMTPGPAAAAPAACSPARHFVDSKFYLLVVLGEVVAEENLKCAVADIEKGKPACEGRNRARGGEGSRCVGVAGGGVP